MATMRLGALVDGKRLTLAELYRATRPAPQQ
jgi:hypothetical protein